MAEEFVSLAALLRASAVRDARSDVSSAPGTSARSESAHPAPRVETATSPSRVATATADSRVATATACEGVVEELALLRLAALEAFDRARSRLLEALARDVLARELMLAPADLDALAARALRDFAESEPLALLVSPADAERVSSPLPVRVDPALSAGDLLLAVHDGEIDARFDLRLMGAIAAAAAT